MDRHYDGGCGDLNVSGVNLKIERMEGRRRRRDEGGIRRKRELSRD